VGNAGSGGGDVGCGREDDDRGQHRRILSQHVSGEAGEVVLRVNNLSSPGLFRDVNFEVRKGEIVGFAGWRSEIAKVIFSLKQERDGRGGA
jgi:ABC-type sugar transport system ATPase subunit